jgi:hypothetical protein
MFTFLDDFRGHLGATLERFTEERGGDGLVKSGLWQGQPEGLGQPQASSID